MIDAVISAPSQSVVKVFCQLKNFYNEEIEYSSKTQENGVTSYTYRLPKNNGNHTYRVSMDGKITKAGYLKLTSPETARTIVTFSQKENPKLRPDYDKQTTLGARMEDSLLLNINSQGYLRMNVGESFKARAYRAAQIINSDTSNIMIEPDFEYKIISGDSVTIVQQDNTATIEAIKNGVSVIEVSYGAIEIGGNTNYTGIYGAVDPTRKGLFIVNVGEASDTKIVLPDWDSELDTFYFSQELGTMDFKPTCELAIELTCNDTVILPDSYGIYKLPIVEGNNIVRISAGGTTEYMVIKGKRITVNIQNTTSPENEIKQGDTIKIQFDGLHMPVPKFSGIYNPGFGGTIKCSFVDPNGVAVQSGGAQYDFINNHAIYLTVYEKGKLSLKNGTISLTSMGYALGSHRELKDTGIGANFNAAEISATFSHLPDINLEVAQNEDISYIYDAMENYCNLSRVSILCGASLYQKSFMFDLKTQAAASKSNNSTTFSSINKAFPFVINVTAINNVSLEFRYFELGDAEKKVVSLTSGKATTLENCFSGKKPIFMEIAVTPKNEIYGKGKVYSYVAYSTSLEKPILKVLTVTDDGGNEYDLLSECGSGLSYTQNSYICYIPQDTSTATISLARLSGSSDIVVNGEQKSVKTSPIAFSPIATNQNETTVSISLADGKDYTIRLIKLFDVAGKRLVCDSEKAAISFLSPVSDTLDFYLASYGQGSSLEKLCRVKNSVKVGENTLYFDLSLFANADNAWLFAWNKNQMPYFDKTSLILNN